MEKVYHIAISMPLMIESRRKLALANRSSSLEMSLSWAILCSSRVFLLFLLFRLDRSCCVKPVSSSSSSPSSEAMSSISQSELDRVKLSVSLGLAPSLSTTSGMSEGRFGLDVFLLLLGCPFDEPCIRDALLRRACPGAGPSDSIFNEILCYVIATCSWQGVGHVDILATI